MRKANAPQPESTLRTRGKRTMLTLQDTGPPEANKNELPENITRTEGKQMMLARQDTAPPAADQSLLPEKGGCTSGESEEGHGEKAGMAFAAFDDLRPWGKISLGAVVVSSEGRSRARRSGA